MSELQFESDQERFLYSRFQKSKQVPAVIRALMNIGVVKTEEQAQYFLIGLVVLIIIVAIYLAHFSFAAAPIQSL